MEYTSSDLDIRNAEELCNAFELADNIVFRSYINRLEELELIEPDKEFLSIEEGKYIRLLRIEKIVYDKAENNLQKLTNLYNMAYSQKQNVLLVINSDGKNVELMLGICDYESEGSNSRLKIGIESLYNGMVGNFPGSLDKMENVLLETEENKEILKRCMEGKNAVSVVSGVASLRTEKEIENDKFVQGIEKFIDSMQGVSFSAIMIANPVSKQELQEIKNELETLYSMLKPFEKTVMSFNEGHSEGVSNAISKGFSDSYGTSKSKSLSIGTTTSTSKTKGYSVGGNVSVGGMISTAVTVGASLALGPIGGSVAKAVSAGLNGSVGLNASVQRSTTQTEGQSRTEANTETTNEQHTETNTTTDSTSSTDSKGSMLQIEYISKNVKQLLDRIDVQLERIKKCESFGIFAVASYFWAKNKGYSNMGASMYKSLISGETTFVENSNIATWSDNQSIEIMKSYLMRMYHPVFKLCSGNNEDTVTAVSLVSGNELAVQMGLPKKSVPGVVVAECASFGRNLYMLTGKRATPTIDIGNIYHMCSDENTRVKLKVEDLSMHTFITGATGSGKSNTVYQLIRKLDEQDIKFMIIEPAKGEYKHVFGNRVDVNVYGTNPNKNRLLRINPFSFPQDIHVLEHIDKLIEIFNVCWPMYAAMPAVLKEAVELAYVSAGWDLDSSVNESNVFPTFTDVLEKLSEVIEASAFSEEVKSNYAGALLTRVKSLTNGINGRIFASNEISMERLFNENVIVDISRVGSMETKSLLMGILVMKLQEHRLDEGGRNKKLHHVTVLEEAHNLLKAGGNSKGVEGNDLVGKSVEMLSNIIAEVRTYGEGFVIVDQAPGLLDASVIRNTNTKIILRLPDYDDRQLVGRAANLSELQIGEIAKLPVGVAAVYHNDWIEPVLCHFEPYDTKQEYKDIQDESSDSKRCLLLKYLVDVYSGKKDMKKDLEQIEKLVSDARISAETKLKLMAVIRAEKEVNSVFLGQVLYELFDDDTAFIAATKANNIEEWTKLLVEHLDKALANMESEYQNIVVRCLLERRAEQDLGFEEMHLKWINYMSRKGVI